VSLICLTELKFDLVPLVCVGVLEEKVKAPGTRLGTLPVLENKVSETEERWVFADAVLKPALV
jgi:hypothetical protein